MQGRDIQWNRHRYTDTLIVQQNLLELMNRKFHAILQCVLPPDDLFSKFQIWFQCHIGTTPALDRIYAEKKKRRLCKIFTLCFREKREKIISIAPFLTMKLAIDSV